MRQRSFCKRTFFEKDENKKALKHIHELGFMIGNHTMTHQNLKDLSEQKQREEIIGVNKAVEKVIGEKPAFSGRLSEAIRTTVTDL
ncbi:polysaccharide deacetylase family protein [Bacillus velezensis]|nr:polysaccharide deacetylase family protein [Bacillus velezensis]